MSKTCIDCDKPISSKKSKRCWACWSKYRKTHHKPMSPETKSKISDKAKKRYQDPNYRERWLQGIKKRSNDESWKRKQKDGSQKRSQKPDYREKLQAGIDERMQSDEWWDAMADNPCWQEGKQHPSWKGGHCSLNQIKRKRKEVKDWRTKVFQRDNYTCQHCRKRGCALHAHHIKSWEDFPELRHDVNNGLTLCVDCHRKVHGHFIPE